MITSHMTRCALVLVAAASVCCWPAAVSAADDQERAYNEALETAQRLDDSAEGQAYEQKFFASIGSELQRAMNECTGSKTPEHRFRLLFVIESGKVAHVLPEPGQAVAACVAPKVSSLPAPTPPAGKWIVSIRMTVTP
jgi:hypothetical protein